MNERQAYDELAAAVSDLRQAVEQYADRGNIERIVGDVLERQRQHGATRRGFQPDDLSPSGSDVVLDRELQALVQSRGSDRINAVLSLPAPQVANALRRPTDDVERFQQTSDRLQLLSLYLQRRPRELAYYRDSYLPALQAMDTGTAAEGLEYVPTALSSALIERVNADLLVAALFPQIEMPTNPYEIPGLGVVRQRTAKAVENTADTGQTPLKKLTLATRKVRLSAAKFGAMVLVSKELEEDSLVPILPFLESELIDFIAADIEDTIVNGDTSATHQDSDVVDADDPRKNWQGLRKLVLPTASVDGSDAALSAAMLRVHRSKMGKYGVRPSRIAHVVSMAGLIQLLAETSVLTLDKYGPAATILTGELGKVDGAPVIVSEYQRTDLNAAGVYDGVTDDRTVAHTVYRPGFLLGNRRSTTIAVLRELYAEYDQDAVQVTARKAFAPRYPADTEPIAAETYNLKTS